MGDGNDETHDDHDDQKEEIQQGGNDDAVAEGELKREVTVPVEQEEERPKKRKNRKEGNAKNTKNKQAKIGSALQEAVTTLKRVSNQFASNEFAVFGQHVGIQLSKLPLPTALLLQREIQELITQARLHTLQPPISPSDISPTTSISVTPLTLCTSDYSEPPISRSSQTCTPPLRPNPHIN